MKVAPLIAIALSSGACAWTLPKIKNIRVRQSALKCDKPVTLDAKTNIWLNYTLHPNSIYRKQVLAAADLVADAETNKRAQEVAAKGHFVWIETREEISKINEVVKDVPCNHVLGLVIAGLPYKECLTTGTAPATDPWSYQSEFIDPIVKIIKANPNTAFALIIEPGAMGSFVAKNLQPQGSICEHVKRSWYQNVPYALKSLDLPNVVEYLDGAHGGIFGWKPGKEYWERVDYPLDASKEFLKTWEAAEKPKQFRGLAVNVKSYNSWDMSPGESFNDEFAVCADLFNKARNEKQYLQILARALKTLNSTMPFHNIMDTSRSGIQGIRELWSDWCNVNYSSWGIIPIAYTEDPNLDAFVWTTWGGISDGTSDPSSPNFKSNCGKNTTAFKPMPEKGVFSQAYFEMLLKGKRKETPNLTIRSATIVDEDDAELVRRCDG